MRNLENELSAQRSTMEGQVRSHGMIPTPSLLGAPTSVTLLNVLGEPALQPATEAIAAQRRRAVR